MKTDGGTRTGSTESSGRAAGSITLRELLSALDTSVVELIDAPAGTEIALASVALVDSSDLATETDSQSPLPDLYLHVGIGRAEAVRWFDDVALRPSDHRARAVMSKNAATSTALQAAARRAGVALVAVHPKARWDHVFPLVQRMLDRSRRSTGLGDPDLLATDTDLFGLAQIVAQNAGGMVSIEDAQSHVLAYSASDEAADELRTLSILGREGPRDYLRALQRWGVFDRLRNSDEVIDVPAHRKLGTERRLVVSIRQPSEDATTSARTLGSIWLQQGVAPFADDAEDVLRGASAIAARIISRSLNAPSTEGLLIQRLFGARGGGVDVPSVVSALNLPATGPAAVVGFAVSATETVGGGLTGLGSMLRLQASSFRRDSVATIIGERAYVLLPRFTSAKSVTTWTRQLVEQFEAKRSIALRAAIAIPVPDLGQVAGARVEVDRVLDGTAATFPEGRVTTLAESRTAVLFGEILDLLAEHRELHDPRLDALVDYDDKHASNLQDSAEAYLAAHGDVRAAAAVLQVHPNTLRYRIRRVEEIVGIDLHDASDRMLFELQLALRRRGEADSTHY
ncbi:MULTISPECIES: CdaR family transcriptional regulator [unclassified Rhodococcus (in: high G+C Gram-positive bacteria)]|uniref:PucR family transcriptional regulator n=1 Tax=unclassified Rhodococcus (in: high G+C Gram-positive bacteria) TaxID=192944 RepID=UPI00163A1670|nr:MULTISPECIES: PucR family transcriptional regulator [unclassified Rhodococcus (in: high G+C Gram-positive bacteria)]MBC2642006.1 helix-turn-helix domain-containing protein [Rhodococcus sp. 3A]MBC2893252.1 helix-turn-helix domain-containing protein [Rhodococcus sp. 4CII]